ncbi:MAG: hypothetical protein CMJ48_02525 [Planctomycetaceae bacterium]|nr:hypothetical protein [Planctomycetaceae bacterium]
MTPNLHTSPLNDVLIETGRSLLQYVGECWPWTHHDADEIRKQLDGLVARQRESVGSLVSLINSHTPTFDIGSYPTEYTDLHFVALDFLLLELVDNQRNVVVRIEQTIVEFDDDAIKTFLKETLTDEQSVLEGLRKIAAASN